MTSSSASPPTTNPTNPTHPTHPTPSTHHHHPHHPAKPSSIHIASSAIISETASLSGPHAITIGPHAVLHPRAKLIAQHAAVTIGEACTISERSSVGLLPRPPADDGTAPADEGQEPGRQQQQREVRLEAGVQVEVGAQVEARVVGEGSVIGVNARVGRGAVLGKHCKIGPLCEVRAGEVLPHYTIVYGTGQRRVERAEIADLEIEARRKHVEALRVLVPSNLVKWQGKR
ncbi:MAG: hypothetical protein M1826_005643 [Phylliscum demangeonii]|nr:MAG: hypothetical protein M1826_005643 [Phylliscum demangeonii]